MEPNCAIIVVSVLKADYATNSRHAAKLRVCKEREIAALIITEDCVVCKQYSAKNVSLILKYMILI